MTTLLARLRKEELDHKHQQEETDDTEGWSPRAFATVYKKWPGLKPDCGKTCFSCGKKGHFAKKCPAVKKPPQRTEDVSSTRASALAAFNNRRQSPGHNFVSKNGRKHVKCFNCNEKGHFARKCKGAKKPRQQKAKARAATEG
jgi:hypothetical protein